jgi:hypothetical protein
MLYFDRDTKRSNSSGCFFVSVENTAFVVIDSSVSDAVLLVAAFAHKWNEFRGFTPFHHASVLVESLCLDEESDVQRNQQLGTYLFRNTSTHNVPLHSIVYFFIFVY